MGIENNQLNFHVAAGQDLNDQAKGTGHLYKAINVTSGMIQETGQYASGLLVQNGRNGNNVTFLVSGVGKFVADAAISAGRPLTVVGSGYLGQANSGTWVVGNALETCTSGSVHTGAFDFAKVTFQVNCFGSQ